MQDNNLKYWLELRRMPGIGVGHFHKICQHFSDLEEFFVEGGAWRLRNGLSEQLQLDEEGVAKDLDWLQQSKDHHILRMIDKTYPYYLREITLAPPLLYLQGDPKLLSAPQLAIVGSRNPTPAGIETAKRFAETMHQFGLIITSGLALGIDTASHQGVVANNGKTVAVLGTGMEQVYPKKNRNLAVEIVSKGGVLVSEFPIGTPALPENFPRRNRVISGLSRGVLVIEATMQSGSLITARYANEQGRDVFAIPGSIYNPLAQGCHYLIKQGAKLVENPIDILEEIMPGLIKRDNTPAIKSPVNLASHQQKLLDCINFEPTAVDQIIERSQLTIDKVTALLSTLELGGYVLAVPGGYVRAV